MVAGSSPREWATISLGAMPTWSCKACAVEYPVSAEPPDACPICLDERQFVPPAGQAWTSLEELTAQGYRVDIDEVEPDLFALWTTPTVGIGQHGHLVRTSAGNLLWDPPGFVDEPVVERLRGMGGVAAIAASHPHMFGAQVSWSRALDDAPVYVAAADRGWVQREDDCIRPWSGDVELLPGVTLRVVGGHFPGSAVAHWAAGADGRGVLLSGDTIFPGPSERWVTFLRSYPNDIPLSAAVVDRVVTAVNTFEYDRVYGNFGNTVRSDARAAIRRSADRYMSWVRGDFDHLT
jgi:glyoxylase-like metal-dependent hydrolase (beta-lactamase superfamily II)